jgi:hypothetical protein
MSFSTNRPLGVPEGGTTSQALIKLSNADYDVGWGTGSGGGGSVASVFTRTGDINAQTGDYNSDQVTELVGATNVYFTTARARAAFSNTAPISYSSGVYSIAAATTSVDGYLTSSSWTTFNNKGTGTVTSVALSVPSWLTVSGAVTTTGTLAITATSGQTANFVMATPDGSSGAMSLRALVANDIPNLDASKITSGFLNPAQGGCGVPFYGDGSDGNVTIIGNVSLVREMYYNNLTITGAGNTINTSSYRIFVSGTLDITGAVASSITRNGGTANGASGATGGLAGGTQTGSTVGGGGGGGNGTTATTGTGGAGTASTAITTTLGGTGGTSGAGGGLGAVGTAGVASGAASANRMAFFDCNLLRGASLYSGGTGGSGGSAGTGNGVSAGGGGGGGASGAGIVALFVNILKRDGTTAANAISAAGGTAGAGGNAVAGGGGGGGGGAAGGCIYLVYNSLQGSTGTNIIRASGGTGGTGGTGTTGYYGGTGGQGGNGGRIIVISASTGVVTETDGTQTTASTPSAPTGTAGTAGTSGVTTQASL